MDLATGKRAHRRAGRAARQPGGLRVPRRLPRLRLDARTAARSWPRPKARSGASTSATGARDRDPVHGLGRTDGHRRACASRAASDDDPVRARILRWPVESPDGKRAGLLGARAPLRRRSSEGHAAGGSPRATDLEYAPSFSQGRREPRPTSPGTTTRAGTCGGCRPPAARRRASHGLPASTRTRPSRPTAAGSCS